MRSLNFGRYALFCSAAAAMLAGCAGSQPSIGAPGAIPQTSTIATHAERGKSWVDPGAQDGDLIYVAAQVNSYVISYRTGKLLGTIDGGAEGACSDSEGNVFLTGGAGVLEYRHGGTTPVATLNLPGNDPESGGCASDPVSGNLAVTFSTFGSGGSDENVAIFPDGQGTPTVYQSGIDAGFCGYDNQGNLFVDGYGGALIDLAELPSGSGSFEIISINQSIGGNPWSIQWDGKYMTVEGISEKSVQLSRLQISGTTATIVSTTKFSRTMSKARASWITGSTVLVPFGNIHGIGFWKYPNGGKAERVFSKKVFGRKLNFFNGLTVSVAANR
jgi:hypothetical protein